MSFKDRHALETLPARIEIFGPDRCMFASHMPICKLASVRTARAVISTSINAKSPRTIIRGRYRVSMVAEIDDKPRSAIFEMTKEAL
jgi:hypothetical protein